MISPDLTPLFSNRRKRQCFYVSNVCPQEAPSGLLVRLLQSLKFELLLQFIQFRQAVPENVHSDLAEFLIFGRVVGKIIDSVLKRIPYHQAIVPGQCSDYREKQDGVGPNSRVLPDFIRAKICSCFLSTHAGCSFLGLPVCAEGFAMLVHPAKLSASFCDADSTTHWPARRSAKSLGRVTA